MNISNIDNIFNQSKINLGLIVLLGCYLVFDGASYLNFDFETKYVLRLVFLALALFILLRVDKNKISCANHAYTLALMLLLVVVSHSHVESFRAVKSAKMSDVADKIDVTFDVSFNSSTPISNCNDDPENPTLPCLGLSSDEEPINISSALGEDDDGVGKTAISSSSGFDALKTYRLEYKDGGEDGENEESSVTVEPTDSTVVDLATGPDSSERYFINIENP